MTEKKKKKNVFILICILAIGIIAFLFCLANYWFVSEPAYPGIEISKISDINYSEIDKQEELEGDLCEILLNGKERQQLDNSKLITTKEKAKFCKQLLLESEYNSPLKISPIQDMNISRGSVKLVKLKNNDVLIIGGDKNNSVELFDYKTKSFKLITKSINPYLVKNTVPYVQNQFTKQFKEPILLPNGNIFYCGAIFDNKYKKMRPVKLPQEEKVLNFFLNISSSEWLNRNKYRVFNIYPNGYTLFGAKCNSERYCLELLLETPLQDIKYKPVPLTFMMHKFNSIYLGDDSIIIDQGYQLNNNTDNRFPIQGLWLINSLKGTSEKLEFSWDNQDLFDIEKLTFNTIFLGIAKWTTDSSLPSLEESEWRVDKKLVGINLSIFNVLDKTSHKVGMFPIKQRFIGVVNNNYIVFRQYTTFFYVFDMNSKKHFRTFASGITSVSNNFIKINNDEFLVLGGYSGNKTIKTSKYAAILSLTK